CKQKISIRYPLVELSVAFLFLLTFIFSGMALNLKFFAGVFLVINLVPIFMIDLEHQVIPEHLTLPGIVVGLVLSPLLLGGLIGFVNSLLGILVGGGSLLLLSMLWKTAFKKEGMGFGDVELMAFLGAFLGWQKILLVIFAASLLGVAFGMVIMFLSKKFRKERVLPFGPFIALSGFLAFYWGETIIHWFLRLYL
ncbi:prepilin peptidase, partial [bacterium]|nr:prepilin peptidase [bacterium]